MSRQMSVVAVIFGMLLCGAVSWAGPALDVSVTLEGPDEGFADEGLDYTATGSFDLDGATQTEVTNGEATVEEEYTWSYAPASCDTGPANGSEETFRFALEHAPGEYTITVTYTVTVRYKDGTSDQDWDSDSIDVEVLPNLNLSVTSGRSAICAGGVESAAHQTTITATLTDGLGAGVQGKTVLFSLSNSDPNHPASCSPEQATTDSAGRATTVLTSSVKIGATTTVTASCEGEQAETEPITMVKAVANWAVDPEFLIADGESTADITLTLSLDGAGADGHEITWRICRIWDASGALLYTADPQSGSSEGYGSIATGPETTDGAGTVTTVYTVGTEAGTVEFEALDYTVVENSPATYKSKDEAGGGVARPTKVDIQEIWVSDTQGINDVGSTLYQAHYTASGTVMPTIQHKPLANAKADQFGVDFSLLAWPAGSYPDVTWRCTWHVLAGDIVKKTAPPNEGTGFTGAYDATTPDCVGAYDFKQQFSLYQAGDWRGKHVEHSDLYLTYSAPYLCASSDFSVPHLERVCGLCQGTNDLSASGPCSTPRKLQLNLEGASNYQSGTLFETAQHWQMVMGQLSGDCDDWASAMKQALALLGVSASEPRLVEEVDIVTMERHYFYMLPNHSGPWNFHAVCQVDGAVCYSPTQPNYPVGSWEDMNREPPDPERLVIDEWAGWY